VVKKTQIWVHQSRLKWFSYWITFRWLKSFGRIKSV